MIGCVRSLLLSFSMAPTRATTSLPSGFHRQTLSLEPGRRERHVLATIWTKQHTVHRVALVANVPDPLFRLHAP